MQAGVAQRDQAEAHGSPDFVTVTHDQPSSAYGLTSVSIWLLVIVSIVAVGSATRRHKTRLVFLQMRAGSLPFPHTREPFTEILRLHRTVSDCFGRRKMVVLRGSVAPCYVELHS